LLLSSHNRHIFRSMPRMEMLAKFFMRHKLRNKAASLLCTGFPEGALPRIEIMFLMISRRANNSVSLFHDEEGGAIGCARWFQYTQEFSRPKSTPKSRRAKQKPRFGSTDMPHLRDSTSRVSTALLATRVTSSTHAARICKSILED
jgi:hypothetical protein